jgi:hypothetical protein
MLEKTLSLFSVLSRTYDESDVSLKRRNLLLYNRNGDTIWGNCRNIIKLFKAFFNSEYVYIVNNTDEITNNLILDGDFEDDNEAWIFDSCEINTDACFSGRFGVLLDGDSKCSQSVNINTDTVYFVHFFHMGNIAVEIKDNNGRFWKPAAKNVDEFGSWVNTKQSITLPGNSEEWEAGSIFFISDDLVSSVTISFLGIDDEKTYLDYIRLNKKDIYPSFSLVVVFTGRSSPETIGLAPGKDDPIEKVDYSKMSYIEHAHIYGVANLMLISLYTELLEIVQAGGISSYIEILIKEDEGENYV